ncbi:hypothetical protein EJ06DRAFT_451924, partial [Trichodelitschia bisporula]
LEKELPARLHTLLYDDLVPRPSHVLSATLAGFIPNSWLPRDYTSDTPDPTTVTPPTPIPSQSLRLPIAHHLAYFNPALPFPVLLPDGTDPSQSPGAPFVRRMWAGGRVYFGREGLKLDGSRAVCVEGIRDVRIAGPEGAEKVFVGIERRMTRVGDGEGDEEVRGRVWDALEGERGVEVVERRNIVFMRERSAEELEALKRGEAPVAKVLKATKTPTFTHTLTPTASLLFRYSALTFNAHAIHLDPHYCRTVEGHRGLLFHGPLSFTLLATMLQAQVAAHPRWRGIEWIEYRNLAPLYAEEEMRLCGTEVGEEGKFEVWVEGPNGGVAVRGTAKV